MKNSQVVVVNAKRERAVRVPEVVLPQFEVNVMTERPTPGARASRVEHPRFARGDARVSPGVTEGVRRRQSEAAVSRPTLVHARALHSIAWADLRALGMAEPARDRRAPRPQVVEDLVGRVERSGATSVRDVLHRSVPPDLVVLRPPKELRCSSSACRISACDHPRGASTTTRPLVQLIKGTDDRRAGAQRGRANVAVLVDT